MQVDTSQTVQVTVLTDSEDEGQETLTLTLSNPSQATLDDATGAGTIENGESSSGTQEDPPAETPVVLLTASFANVPATHNGSAFTFDLTFSEEFGISYVTLRDDAFNVTGGTVENAQRTDKPSNISWRITVKPTPHRGRYRGPAGNHGLQCRGSHLHRGRPEIVQLAELHRIRTGPVDLPQEAGFP